MGHTWDSWPWRGCLLQTCSSLFTKWKNEKLAVFFLYRAAAAAGLLSRTDIHRQRVNIPLRSARVSQYFTKYFVNRQTSCHYIFYRIYCLSLCLSLAHSVSLSLQSHYNHLFASSNEGIFISFHAHSHKCRSGLKPQMSATSRCKVLTTFISIITAVACLITQWRLSQFCDYGPYRVKSDFQNLSGRPDIIGGGLTLACEPPICIFIGGKCL